MQTQALRLLDLVTDAEQRIADGSALVLTTISADPAVQDRNPAVCQRLLEKFVAAAPRYGFAALIAPDGHMVCGSGTGEPGINAWDRPYFQRAMETGAFSVGDYAIGRGTGKPSLHFAQPVRDANGAITGVVMASLSLAWLQTQLEGFALPEGTIAAIADRNGIVLARTPYEAGRIGQPLRPETRLVLQGSAIGITHITDRQGRDRLMAYAPPGAGPQHLAVLVALDSQTAFASITKGNRFRLGLIVISSLFALLLTGVSGRRLINRPVARLLETAERWRAGDLAARSELRQDRSEFGRLATAFDNMAETLQAREQALNMALESTLDAVVVLDRDWRYVYTNAAAKALHGCDRTGRILWEDTPEAVGTPIAAALLEAVNTGKPTQVEGYVVTLKSYLQVNAYPSDGGLTVFTRDLTEERRTAAALRESEARLRSLTKTLEQRIEQEVAAREAAQSRAAQAERIQALGQLAGGIAHDFNNVLQATIGALSLIERRPDDREGIRRIARMAAQACERGAAITRRLLGFARRGELRAARVEIPVLLAGLQEILSHTLGAAIEVNMAVADALAPAFVDRSQLETVLVNLATNARDAMPTGGRLIFSASAETLPPNGPPHPSGLPQGRYIRLAVADTGHGMDAATLARAAEPFFTTKGHGDGTGLGLSMAKGFAEQSGGAFAIASTPGLGATITLWLPEAAADTLALAPVHGDLEESEAGAAAHRKLVLLVDDQDSVREILAAQLNDAGFEVVPAAGGAQAISLLSGGLCVDALVTDLSMPQVDGLAVIKAAQDRLPRLPAILLTGYAGDDAALAVSGAISGTFSLLRKPVEDAQLIDRLRTLLAAGDGEEERSSEEKEGLLF
jgi:signal transduction histidine kinase/ActR/RegA family two-component response regulator/HAMP domain-containing protein